jgi:hypothetical protein
MAKRRTAEQIQLLLKDTDRDLARGLTVADVCHKFGITQSPTVPTRAAHRFAAR